MECGHGGQGHISPGLNVLVPAFLRQIPAYNPLRLPGEEEGRGSLTVRQD